jgi:hypothetical protein
MRVEFNPTHPLRRWTVAGRNLRWCDQFGKELNHVAIVEGVCSQERSASITACSFAYTERESEPAEFWRARGPAYAKEPGSRSGLLFNSQPRQRVPRSRTGVLLQQSDPIFPGSVLVEPMACSQSPLNRHRLGAPLCLLLTQSGHSSWRPHTLVCPYHRGISDGTDTA